MRSGMCVCVGPVGTAVSPGMQTFTLLCGGRYPCVCMCGVQVVYTCVFMSYISVGDVCAQIPVCACDTCVGCTPMCTMGLISLRGCSIWENRWSWAIESGRLAVIWGGTVVGESVVSEVPLNTAGGPGLLGQDGGFNADLGFVFDELMSWAINRWGD